MKDIWTVTKLNDQIKGLLEEGFDVIWVEGEVSNLRCPASGHVYFTLRDEKSQIRAVIFRSPYGHRASARDQRVRFDLEEGMQIICRARLSVYAARGEYQLIVETVEPKGVGALQKAFEQLKQRLQAEGLFEPARKKPIPFLPRKIGVITSPTGAVIRDILTITRRRFSSVPILIAPVRVQGADAPPEIIRAIRDMHGFADVEVIILARGGGSLEDLAPFNDEGMARAIFVSRIPVVSAVGHETDFTIADFVADLRAPTPSAAAELVLPLKSDLIASAKALHLRMIQQHRLRLQRFQEKVLTLTDRLQDPKRRLTDIRLRIDDTLERLQRAFKNQTGLRRQALLQRESQLRHVGPLGRIRDAQFILENLRKNMIAGTLKCLENLKNRLSTHMAVLDSLSPLTVLSRGYAIVRRLPDGHVVRKANEVSEESTVEVRVASGRFEAKIVSIYQEQE
ncbi:MAG: exodeoxyribonuclease VII large subunit [Pseudomonadota bacterium]